MLRGKNFDTEIDDGGAVAKRRLRIGHSFGYRIHRIQINNTVFDNTNKDGGYKGSVKMIEGVLNKKYVIHSTLFYRKNRDLALLLIK